MISDEISTACPATIMRKHDNAKIIGLGDQKGSIEDGKDANLICFDKDINISGVMVEGKGLLGQLS